MSPFSFLFFCFFFGFGFWFVWFVWFWFQLSFLFWFWFGGLSCVNCVCFFQCFGLLFFVFGFGLGLWWVCLFKFCLLVLVWLDFLGFSAGGVTIYTHQMLHRISEDIKKSHRMPPKIKSYRTNDKAMEISRQEEEFGSQNFSRCWRKRTGKFWGSKPRLRWLLQGKFMGMFGDVFCLEKSKWVTVSLEQLQWYVFKVIFNWDVCWVVITHFHTSLLSIHRPLTLVQF